MNAHCKCGSFKQTMPMSAAELLHKELDQTPDEILIEVYRYLRYLKSRSSEEEAFNGLVLSETALSKDWNTPEEDRAWANL